MNETDIHSKLAGAVVSGVGALDESAKDPFVVVDPGSLVPAVTFLKNDADCRMEMLNCVTAVEREDCIEVVYHLSSVTHRHSLTLKTRVERPAGGTHESWIPEVPSVAALYASADWHEREQWDLLGVRFTDHPDHRRILLPEEWIGHPLRKDYVYPHEHGGMPLDLDAVPLYERDEATPSEPAAPRPSGTPLVQPPNPNSDRPDAGGVAPADSDGDLRSIKPGSNDGGGH